MGSLALPDVVLLGAAVWPAAVLHAALLVPLLEARAVRMCTSMPLGGTLSSAAVLSTVALCATLHIPLLGVRAALRLPTVLPEGVLPWLRRVARSGAARRTACPAPGRRSLAAAPRCAAGRRAPLRPTAKVSVTLLVLLLGARSVMLRHGALLGGALLLAVVLPAAALLATLRVRLLGVRALLRFPIALPNAELLGAVVLPTALPPAARPAPRCQSRAAASHCTASSWMVALVLLGVVAVVAAGVPVASSWSRRYCRLPLCGSRRCS